MTNKQIPSTTSYTRRRRKGREGEEKNQKEERKKQKKIGRGEEDKYYVFLGLRLTKNNMLTIPFCFVVMDKLYCNLYVIFKFRES